MKTSPDGRSLIEAFEGLFLTAYRDAVGVLTIGYGHTSAAGPPEVTTGMRISLMDADAILRDDLAKVERNVAACISVALEQYEFDALVSFDFNTGALARSSVRSKINSGDKAGAMATLMLYDHAGGRVLSGLSRRRQAEKLMFLGKVQQALSLAGAHVTLSNNQPVPKAEPRPVNVPPPPDVTPVPLPPARPPIPAKHAASGGSIVAAIVAALQAHTLEMAIGIIALGIIAAVAIHFLWPKKGS